MASPKPNVESGEGDKSTIPVDKHATPQKEKQEIFDNLEARGQTQDLNERRTYSARAYWITMVWLSFIIYVTVMQQLMSIDNNGLKTPEFIAIITTTIASMLAFWWLVGRDLFKGPDKPPKD